ncbi:MAG: hypothetical protein J6T02_04760 [Bacteroidales bacterium]|nr:hypothetical protein [Bacteroidales bacterium]
MLWSCANMDYDIGNGIDNEYTLFSDEVSVPVASGEDGTLVEVKRSNEEAFYGCNQE